MGTLQIRHLPEDVREALAFRAEREHRSLAQQAIVELRRIPEIQGRLHRLAIVEHIAADLAGGDVALPFEPEDAVRDDRAR